MRKFRCFFSLFFIIVSVFVYGQNRNDIDINTDRSRPAISIFAQPLNIIAIYPRLQLGIDFRTANNFVIGIVGATGIQNTRWGPTEFSFKELRPQIRHYVIQSPYFLNVSVGFELFFTQINEVKYNSAYHPMNGYSRLFTQANYSESRKGFNFFGTFSIYDNRSIVLEAYLGFGYVFRNIEYTNVIDAPVSTSGGGLNLFGDGFGPPPKKNDGEQNRLSVTLGFKIGYRFSLGK